MDSAVNLHPSLFFNINFSKISFVLETCYSISAEQSSCDFLALIFVHGRSFGVIPPPHQVRTPMHSHARSRL